MQFISIALRKKIDEIESREASKLEEEIMAKGHISDDDIIQVIDEMVTEKIKDLNECKEIKTLGRSIYEEVRK